MDVVVLVKPARADPARPDAADEETAPVSRWDRAALEAARAVKARHEARVHLLAAAPSEDASALEAALETVGDTALLVADERMAEADPWGTAHVLEAGARHLADPDLVLAGVQGPRRGSGQTGPRVAELLETPLATRATALSLTPGEDAFEATRRADGLEQKLRGPLPATVTVHPAFEADLHTVRDRLAARDVDAAQPPEDAVETCSLDALDAHENLLGRAGSPTRVLETMPPADEASGEARVHATADEATIEQTARSLLGEGSP